MKWLYDYEYNWMGKGKDPIVCLLLRPTIFDPEGYQMIGKIVKLRLIAAEHIMTNKVLEESRKDKDFARIYFEELCTKDYYIKHDDVKKEDEIHLASAYIYVKQDHFTTKEIFDWVKTYFTIKGYQHSEFERTDANNFLDLNPIYNMLIEVGKKLVEEDERDKAKPKNKRPKKL